ncbi:uncharacterized protein LOC117338862 [Pecten maximus]|uniref:uncharacterized protein LOC117338862 n=1 Tax=Pecten maximus TaxID=6579 RepID=UPI001458E914|nr:uncharacterized protein LOC117338862 [Pecten maximus]
MVISYRRKFLLRDHELVMGANLKAIVMGRRHAAGIRQAAVMQKQRMRERRAARAESPDASASDGLGEPSPVLATAGKSPNALSGKISKCPEVGSSSGKSVRPKGCPTETEPEIYPLTPLCLKSKETFVEQFGFKNIILDSNTQITKESRILARPKQTKTICGDGNCYFRAVSHVLCDSEENHMFFRNEVVNHMIDNDLHFRSHLRSGERSVSNYVVKKRMLHNGTWATEVEILAAADFLKTDIYIYDDAQSTWLKFSAKQVRPFVDVHDESIYLIHKYQAHYDVVLDVMEKDCSVETFAGNKQNIYFAVQSTEEKQQKEQTEPVPMAVQGHFDQSDPRFLDNAGKQCVMNSLSALIYSCNKHTTAWTPFDVDQILTKGNEMYEILQRSSTIEHDLLAINEIPRCVEYNDELYHFTFQESLMGTLDSTGQNLDEFQFYTLDEALTISLMQDDSQAAFVTFRGNTFVVIKQDNLYCICDSHSRNLTGIVDPNGSSTVIHYQNIEYVLHHCLQLAESLACQINDVFEITAVTVSKASSTESGTSRASSLSNKNQKTEKDSKKQRLIDVQKKANARAKNPERYKAVDLQSKTTAREKNPEKHRAIDKQSKANVRDKNPEKHRAIDKQSKTNARDKNPEKHRAIDKQSKANARDKNPEKHRAIDKQSKANARDKDPEKQRLIDVQKKANARAKNPERKHRAIDKQSKANARDKNPKKLKELDLKSKQQARKDPLYLEQELLVKKKARLDPLFLHAEAKADVSRKRQLRLNKNFLENERLKQVERRKRNTTEHKALDRKRKADNRNHDTFSGNERHQYKKRRFGNDISECITVFQRKIQRGPEYVCTCCQQTWFSESVKESSPIPVFPQYTDFYTGFKSVDGKEWICHTCYASLKKCKVPKLSVKNGMKWPEKPPELDLHPLEERLVALRIPFMQIRELPRGGQYSVKGNVVNVPIDIQPTINALPRQMDEHFTVAVKMKKRLTYKSCVLSENVRPNMVLSALHWLMKNSDLYKNSCIKIDDDWLQKTAESAEEIVQEFTKAQDNESNVLKNQSSSIPSDQFKTRHFKENDSDNKSYDDSSNACEKDDNFIEMNEDECIQGNSDTLIDEANLDTNKELVFAPGEGQQPIGLYHDEDAEVLSFPSIYCAQKRLKNNERQTPVSYSDLAKWELRSVDRRAAASVPNIFFKLNKIQRKQVADKVNLAIRRKKSDGNKITASDAQNPEIADKIVSLNEGYYIFRTLRNSPAYLSSRKKDVFAMIRQIGLPTWFMSLSSADTRWNELLKTLAVLSGTPCSDQQIRNMTWSEKVKLVQKDPVTCSRYFDQRVQVFMNTVLKSEHAPIGSVTDTFQRIEFQNRGSPHVHMMIWTENAPKYNIDSEEDIIRYVDKHVTCSLAVDDDMQEFIKMQVHKHSKTCKKGGRSVCRFGFPLPPLPNTMLLEPLETDIETGCDMSYEEFLTEVVQIEEAEYIKCIRSSLKGPKIFLKREPKEMRVNYYNTTVLQAWKANLHLQFVLDPYACAMYIVSYISKSQRGMSTMLEQASKEAAEGNIDLKRQVRHIGNKFLNFVEISAQEASYLVLQMPLTRASREVIFINTSLPKDRVFLLKSQEQLKDLPKNSTDVESDNIIKRYARRPKKLENYCLADYVSELDVKYKKNKAEFRK